MAFGVKLGRKGRTLGQQLTWELKTMTKLAALFFVVAVLFAFLCAVFH